MTRTGSMRLVINAGVIDRNSGDTTVILKKENNKWVIKTKPQIINTIYNTKDIPEDILSETASRLSPFSTLNS